MQRSLKWLTRYVVRGRGGITAKHVVFFSTCNNYVMQPRLFRRPPFFPAFFFVASAFLPAALAFGVELLSMITTPRFVYSNQPRRVQPRVC